MAPKKVEVRKYTEAELKELLDNSWLNLGDTSKIFVENPLKKESVFDIENPHIHLLNVIRNPDNFAFTCKHILNKTLLPFQLAILRELWYRPFPMLIASRGASKSWLLALYTILRCLITQGSKVVCVGAAFRQSKVVFEYCVDIWDNAPVLRSLVGDGGGGRKNGPRRDIDRCSFRLGDSVAIYLPLSDGCVVGSTQIMTNKGFTSFGDLQKYVKTPITAHDIQVWGNQAMRHSDEFYINGVKPTKKIVTKKGYEFEGTHNHKIKVFRNGQIIWERLDSITQNDHIILDRTERWHNGTFACTEDQAYALGCILGDGCWTGETHIGYATMDQELIEGVRRGTGYAFSYNHPNDTRHFIHRGRKDRQAWLDFWGLKKSYAHEKTLPESILSSRKECLAACLSALFDTDGHLQVSTRKGGTAVMVGFTNTSEVLVKQIQFILLHFGIISSISKKQRANLNWRMCYTLIITGQNAELFAVKIGFRLKRKQEKLLAGIAGKVCSTALINKFIDVYHNEEPEFCDRLKVLADEHIYYDKVMEISDGNAETFDIHVPETHEYCANGFFSHNTKIRGQRATHLIGEEFASIPVAVWENVVSGFAAVNANPVNSHQQIAKRKKMQELGFRVVDDNQRGFTGNQSIIAGTAYYSFNHFFEYWKRWKGIVESKGDRKKLAELFNGEVPPKFDHKDYSIIRIPVDMLPEGFMDERQIAKQRASVSVGIYLMEYGACFSVDSAGFFKRSLIESCVVGNPARPISLPSESNISFSAALKGNQQLKYVIGVDPASERDNFSIVVLELRPDHRRIVHCWTTTNAKFKKKQKMGLVQDGEDEFYGFAARKIRDLIKLFPCDRIAIDSQGGGRAVLGALQSQKNLLQGERPILQVIDHEKPKDTDNQPGDHIIELIEFAQAEWVSTANHGMRQDFENKTLLFPCMDSAELGLAYEEDKAMGRIRIKDGEAQQIYDTLEDCVMEIEELKDELATIVHTQTGTTLRDRWDTPETKLPGNKKGRLRKDRYSALLMANAIARVYQAAPVGPRYSVMGGFAHEMQEIKQNPNTMTEHQNPEWYTQVVMSPNYGAVVSRH